MLQETAPHGTTHISHRPLKKVKQYPGLLRLASLVGAVPLSIRSGLGWALGYCIGLLPLRERTFAMLHLKVFLPQVSALTVTPRVFANAGQTLLESLNLQPLVQAHPSRITCEAWGSIQHLLAKDQPVIALTAHTGNWDLLAAWVIAQGVPLTTIGREARKPSAQAILRSIRDGYGIETIWRSDRSGLKRLISRLKEGRVIAALIDQDTRVESISVPFFGVAAKTPVSLVTLGQKMNARFVTAFIFRTGWLRFSVFLEEIPESTSPEEVLTIYNHRLETLIKRYPEQWVWFHKRWRSQPNQETLSSKQYRELLKQNFRKIPPPHE